MSDLLKKGSKGDAVRMLQQNLTKLGFAVDVDGIFGPGTDSAVRELQALFGYTVDGLVGPGTQKLVEAQVGHGWNKNAPDAAAKAAAANPRGFQK